MPGKEVKNWKQYEALRQKGLSKTAAARIANSGDKRRSNKKKRSGRKKGK